MSDGTDPVSGLRDVQARIARACADSGRPADAVTLVVVSKTFGPEAIAPVIATGHRVFGENRVQEAAGKWPALREATPGIELHLIGPLQSNKARDAVTMFDVIETVDRPKIAEAIAEAAARTGRMPRLLIQVNTGAEPQKAGVLPDEADQFVALCRDTLALPIEGLMCIPPAEEQASPHFALLATIAQRNGVKTLSMGMSSDFELGIQLGATHVRVGSAIFGHRPKP